MYHNLMSWLILFVIMSNFTSKAKSRNLDYPEFSVAESSAFSPYFLSILMSHITRKPVFGRLRPDKACSAAKTSQSLEILDLASKDIILSRKRTIKTRMLIFAFVVRIWHKTGFLMMWSVRVSEGTWRC